MKTVYISAKHTEEADSIIKKIQRNFSAIYQSEESVQQEWIRGNFELDSILMYHLRSVDDGNKDEDFYKPFAVAGESGSLAYIKEKLGQLNNDSKLEYCQKLSAEFLKSVEIICQDIPTSDGKNKIYGDVLLLDKERSLIFLLRGFRASEKPTVELLEKWENFVFLYKLASAHQYFHGLKYKNRHKFDQIYNKNANSLESCHELLGDFYSAKKRFSNRWENLHNLSLNLFIKNKNNWIHNAFNSYHHLIGYILYKYEVQNGGDHSLIRKKIFKTDKFSIDHIVAQSLSWEALGYGDYYKDDLDPERKVKADEEWKNILEVIHGIGNLSLSTVEYNSSASNGLPEKHVEIYKSCGLEKTATTVETWKETSKFVNNINDRSEEIINFIQKKFLNASCWADYESSFSNN